MHWFHAIGPLKVGALNMKRKKKKRKYVYIRKRQSKSIKMGPIPSLLLLFFYRFSFLLLDVSPFVGSAIGLGRCLFPLFFL
jgi:hypothetical protein